MNGDTADVEIQNSNTSSEEQKLIGIVLEPDGSIRRRKSDTVVGSFFYTPNVTTLCELRIKIQTQISVHSNFKFMNKQRIPIEKDCESTIYAEQVIYNGVVRIQRNFDLPRLGIQWFNRTNIGYINIAYNSNLIDVRQKILSVLGEKMVNRSFEFIEKNGWPVMLSQERSLVVWDIVRKNYCVIKETVPVLRSLRVVIPKPFSNIKKRPLEFTAENSKKQICLKPKSNQCSVLISYVHVEASAHAQNLKRELLNMGLDKVFLDIDDIPPGRDWQDVVNLALSNCNVFVALVTPRYGETRWTNREAKLADDKEKLIIPISFLEKWPPDHLAIQFLTLQYIPWKTNEELEHGDTLAKDISSWDQRSIHRVASEIKKLCKDVNMLPSDCLPGPEIKHQAGSSFMPSLPPLSTNAKKDYIVISAHSKQEHFVEKIAKLIKEMEYDVWLSYDMDEISGDVVDSSCEDSQISEYSPFLESEKPFYSKIFGRENSESDDAKNVKCTENEVKIKNFKKKVKEAFLVIIVMSADYISSRTCLQLAYYCEYRRKTIVVKFGDFSIDDFCILNFYPEKEMVKFADSLESIDLEDLRKEIVKTKDNSDFIRRYTDLIQIKADNIALSLNMSCAVYVIGGRSGVTQTAEQFCVCLGAELAKIPELILCTEGFCGIGDLIAKNFCEEKQLKAKGKPENLYHIVPHQTEAGPVLSSKGHFTKLSHGQTIFHGNSITERDDIVSAAFKICIMVEGGQRTACLAEKFLFNDCLVIPVILSNSAVSTKRCLRESLLKVPCGVKKSDWAALLDFKSPPDFLAKSVKDIVSSLLKKSFCPQEALKAVRIKHNSHPRGKQLGPVIQLED